MKSYYRHRVSKIQITIKLLVVKILLTKSNCEVQPIFTWLVCAEILVFVFSILRLYTTTVGQFFTRRFFIALMCVKFCVCFRICCCPSLLSDWVCGFRLRIRHQIGPVATSHYPNDTQAPAVPDTHYTQGVWTRFFYGSFEYFFFFFFYLRILK